jgi:hypothetical protein
VLATVALIAALAVLNDVRTARRSLARAGA